MFKKRLSNRFPNQNAGIPCQAQWDVKQRSHLAKMRIAKAGARVRSLSKRGSGRRSMIKCSKQPGQLRKGIEGKREGDFFEERVGMKKATGPLAPER